MIEQLTQRGLQLWPVSVRPASELDRAADISEKHAEIQTWMNKDVVPSSIVPHKTLDQVPCLRHRWRTFLSRVGVHHYVDEVCNPLLLKEVDNPHLVV